MGETKNGQINDFSAGVTFSPALMKSSILCLKIWVKMSVCCFKNLSKYINLDNMMNCSFQNNRTMLKLHIYFE